VSKTVLVLAISGGGVRGIIPAVFCKKIEAFGGAPLCRQFDLIAGTSTGGVIALLLTRPNPDKPDEPMFLAQDVADLYLKHAKDIFSPPEGYSSDSGTRPAFPPSNVVGTFEQYFPKQKGCELRDALTHTVVTSYDLVARAPYLFDSSLARTSDPDNYYMLDAAQATSAFPGLFGAGVVIKSVNLYPDLPGLDAIPQVRAFIDGGVSGANPAMTAYSTARAMYGADTDIIVVSMGTGHYMETIPPSEDWGIHQWAGTPAEGMPLVDVLFDATDHSADDLAALVLPKDNYFRLQIDLPKELSGIATFNDVPQLADVAEKAIETTLKDTFDRLQMRMAGAAASRTQKASA
jgi:predicted acylesterase/phospholipase RssA